MPLLKLTVSVDLDEKTRSELLSKLSKTVAQCTGKPEQYVMVALDQAAMIMNGQEGEAAFGDVRGIGLGGNAIPSLSKSICSLLDSQIGIPPARVYLNFTSIPANQWGWDGATFG